MSMAEFPQIPLAPTAVVAKNIPALCQKPSYKNIVTLPVVTFTCLKENIFRSVDDNITEPEYAL